jgi:hypothetical protein
MSSLDFGVGSALTLCQCLVLVLSELSGSHETVGGKACEKRVWWPSSFGRLTL